MKPTDAARFYQGLKSLEVFFRDPLTEEHELLYWDTMRELCTIEEWLYACEQIRSRHDFHMVPLPAVMLTYADAYRAEANARRDRQQQGRQLDVPEPSRDPNFHGTEAERRAHAWTLYPASLDKLERLWGKEWRVNHERMMATMYPAPTDTPEQKGQD